MKLVVHQVIWCSDGSEHTARILVNYIHTGCFGRVNKKLYPLQPKRISHHEVCSLQFSLVPKNLIRVKMQKLKPGHPASRCARLYENSRRILLIADSNRRAAVMEPMYPTKSTL